jgi:hypothetical protein
MRLTYFIASLTLIAVAVLAVAERAAHVVELRAIDQAISIEKRQSASSVYVAHVIHKIPY